MKINVCRMGLATEPGAGGAPFPLRKKLERTALPPSSFSTEEHKGILGHIDQKARQSPANPWVKISGNLYRFRYMFLYVYQTHMSFNEITAPGAVKRFL